MNKQMSLSFIHDELKEVKTHKREFLEKMDAILPCEQLYKLVKPCYYEGVRGNKPYDLELMLRIHLIQNLYDLSDEGTRNEIIDSRAFSDFCEVESSNQIPDGDTIGRFRNLLIQNHIHEQFFAVVLKTLTDRGLILKKGTIVDSTIPLLFLPRPPQKTRRKSVIRTHTPSRKETRGTLATKHT